MPKLPIPQVTLFLSEIGNKYVRERTFDELSAKLMEEIPPEGEEATADQRTSTALSVHKSTEVPVTSVSVQQPSKLPEQSVMKSVDRAVTAGSVNTVQETQDPAMPPEEPPFKPNDYLQKAEMEPPCDPQG